MGSKWDTIESDPAVFTGLLEQLGVEGVEVAEVLTLDDLPACCHGLIFLFQYTGQAPAPPAACTSASPAAAAPWFARQTIHNACGTQALLHILLNRAATHTFSLGPVLEGFRSFTAALPPEERGSCFEQCEAIRSAHNSFARPEPFLREERAARPGEKGRAPFHFLAYTELGGQVYELDGLSARGAVALGAPPSEGASWLQVARAAITARVAQYSSGAGSGGGEIRFSLLAVVPDALLALRQRFSAACAALERQHALLQSHGAEGGLEAPGSALARWRSSHPGLTPAPLPPAAAAGEGALEAAEQALDPQALAASYSALLASLEAVAEGAGEELRKRAAWGVENAQRRHNFVPLIMALLSGLAEGGVLGLELSAARGRYAGRLQRARQEGRDAMEEEDQ